MLRIFLVLIALISSSTIDAVELKVLRGAEISPYTNDIVELCHKIYRETPYHYNGESSEYLSYLESFSQIDDAMICIVIDNKKIVGIAAGMPMDKTRDLYKQALLQQGYDLSKYFYIGEFGLAPEYQEHGIEEEMHKVVEHFASENKFKRICVWELENTSSQTTYVPKSDFWKKNDFEYYPELNFSISWTNINEKNESQHLAYYWIKYL